MAFLDNSGDIILDAVLTDNGRKLLSKGDGSFKVAKFAFGDDEIDYSLFNVQAATANQDLSILQTPVLEAFTNNASSMKSTLLSIADENLLYLPMLKLNEVRSADVDRHTNGMFTVAVNKETEDKFNSSHKVMYGANPGARHIEIDQGIDSVNFPATRTLSSELVETQYLVTIDSRFGTIISDSSTSEATLSNIDDDQIASYYLTNTTLPPFVTVNTNTSTTSLLECITGARATMLKFRIMGSIDLNGGAYFDDMGSTVSMTDAGGTSTYKYIDSMIQIKGLTTGYPINIPIRYIRFSVD